MSQLGSYEPQQASFWDKVIGFVAQGYTPDQVQAQHDSVQFNRLKMASELATAQRNGQLSQAALMGLPGMGGGQSQAQPTVTDLVANPDSADRSSYVGQGPNLDGAPAAVEVTRPAQRGLFGGQAPQPGGPVTLADVRPNIQALMIANDPRGKELQSLYNEAAPNYDVSNGQRYDKKSGATLPGVVGASMDVTPSGISYNRFDPRGLPAEGNGAPPVAGLQPRYDPATGRFAGYSDPNGTVNGALGNKAYAEAYPQALARAQTSMGSATDEQGRPLQNVSQAEQLGLVTPAPMTGPRGRGAAGGGGAGASQGAAGRVPSMGQGPQGKAETEGSGKAMAERFDAIQKAASTASETRDTIQQLRQYMPKVSTGAMASARYGVGAMAAGMGLDIKGLNEAQAFQAVGNKLALSARAMLPGQFSDADRNFVINLGPNLSKQPGANNLLLDAMEKISNRQIHYAAAAQAWKDKNGTINGFEPAYRVYAAKHPLFGGKK